MSEPYLTMAEIEARYPNEWVLIDRPKTTRLHDMLGGYVVAHSPDRDEFDRALLAFEGGTIATLYTGQPEADVIHSLNLWL